MIVSSCCHGLNKIKWSSGFGLQVLSLTCLVHSFLPSSSHILLFTDFVHQAQSLCCWEQHDSCHPSTTAPSLLDAICPTSASHGCYPPSQPINVPLSLGSGKAPLQPCFMLCDPFVFSPSYVRLCRSHSTRNVDLSCLKTLWLMEDGKRNV